MTDEIDEIEVDREIEAVRDLLAELEATGRGDSSPWWGLQARLLELEESRC